MSHYLYPKGEALKRTERIKPLCFFRRRKWQKRLKFEKEYAFCLKVKTKLLKKVEKLYQKQKATGVIRRANCNFSELERAMLNWK